MSIEVIKLKEFNEKFQKLLVKLGIEQAPRTYKFAKDAVTKEGVKIVTESDDWANGVEVFVEVDGVIQPAPDGDHTLEDGTVITVSGGKITEIKAVEADMSDVTEQVEQALSKLKSDSDKFAAELSKQVSLAATEKASYEAELSAKDSEITQLQAQVQTLSEQVRSIQDGGSNPAQSNPKPTAKATNGKPEGWAKMSAKERFDALMEEKFVTTPSNKN